MTTDGVAVLALRGLVWQYVYVRCALRVWSLCRGSRQEDSSGIIAVRGDHRRGGAEMERLSVVVVVLVVLVEAARPPKGAMPCHSKPSIID